MRISAEDIGRPSQRDLKVISNIINVILLPPFPISLYSPISFYSSINTYTPPIFVWCVINSIIFHFKMCIMFTQVLCENIISCELFEDCYKHLCESHQLIETTVRIILDVK